ncbi:MAG TPA: MBL fold metallo-hydrolase [Syntrophorhabdaceae bacterium]|nr:MBL fold metallo-hydrolase [Syntrophorhabdaceae bacterium]
MKIRFLGAIRKVTGSCYHLTYQDTELLVDCGMHQGKDAETLNRRPFNFNPERIDYIIVTHAHLDHSGLIPKLVADGFKGRILTTEATADLLEIMLLDSAHIQEKDAEWMTKKSFRTGKDIVYEPLYTGEDVLRALPFVDRKKYGEKEEIVDGLSYRFLDAGHILGSAILEIFFNEDNKEKKIVFSGDIGKSNNPIIKDPTHIEQADYVIVESTYGNRLHKGMEESIEELAEAIDKTFKRGGNVLIPAFAVGRTQDIIYILKKFIREGRFKHLNVFIDSPLADRATKIYLSHPELFDLEAKDFFKLKDKDGLQLNFTVTVEESQKINKIKSGAIIIAGSGMCEGGRIRHHFKHNIWRPECSIIFSGFQAKGTLGRYIVDGAKSAHILGEEIAIRAKIYTIGGFSAHADQKELLEWIGSFKNNPEIFVVHGEEDVELIFAQVINERLGLRTHVPFIEDELEF